MFDWFISLSIKKRSIKFDFFNFYNVLFYRWIVPRMFFFFNTERAFEVINGFFSEICRIETSLLFDKLSINYFLIIIIFALYFAYHIVYCETIVTQSNKTLIRAIYFVM